MPLFRCILIAADFSERSRKAFHVACSLAVESKSRVLILCVVEKAQAADQPAASGEFGKPAPIREGAWLYDDDLKGQLREFYAPTHSIDVAYLGREVAAAEGILRTASELNADMIAPQQEHVADLVTFACGLLKEPRADVHLLVHCHAGVSRSTASMALILALTLPDLAANRIFEEVLRIRPQAWPNLRILELGDTQLNRRGEFVAAAARIYRTQLDRRQYIIEQMRSNGRGREIEAASS